jgi:hypothetical protein
VDQLFKEAAASENEIYDWQGETEKKASVTKMSFDKFPIDGVMTNITLQLRVMGRYQSEGRCLEIARGRGHSW